ncbi:hypothetical protein DY000_02018460 [Brassica cretica]|uniref:Uncharacterized protein n=1 Tax=Brassica cretica TaxID=69181 RepID=A0ABQ7CXX6_BRACR|nr:hypothetical protein DY000_02018460 [Brassica cretica]
MRMMPKKSSARKRSLDVSFARPVSASETSVETTSETASDFGLLIRAPYTSDTEPVQDIHVFTCFFNTRETHDAMNHRRALSHLPLLCIFNKSHVLVASPQTYLVSLQPHSTKKEQEALRQEPSGSATSVSPKLASLSLLFSCSLFSGL